MNAADIKQKLASPQGRAARLAADSRPQSEKIHELYLAALAREPGMDELLVAEAFVNGSGASRQAWEDLVWAIVNTKEFLFNH
jgi:hypothetical protein